MRYLFLSLVLITLAGQNSQGVQDPAPAIARAAVEYYSNQIRRLPVTIDPRVHPAPSAFTGTEPGLLHSAQVLSSVGIPGVSSVVTLENAMKCAIPNKAECKTNGHATFVLIGRPVIKADTAVLQLFAHVADTPMAADSAAVRALHVKREEEMRDPAYRGPTFNVYDSTRTFERMNRAAGMLYEFRLVRSGTGWTVFATSVLGSS